METATIRKELHNYVETADDKMVKAIYTIVSGEIKESKTIYTEAFTKELERRHDAYKKDTSTAVSAQESKRRIQKILNSRQKK